MTDVFFSYKKEDGPRVEPIARALAQAGYDVWWDHRIPPGRTYRDVIGAALQSAKCVIVVWSKLSANAQWVLDEADEGKKRNVLLPLMIDDVEIPYGFRQIEAARLVGWNGDRQHPEWLGTLSAVEHLVGRPAGGPPRPFATVSHVQAAPPREAAAPTGGARKGGSVVGPVIGVVAVAALIGGGYLAWNAGLFDGAQTIAADDAEVPADAEAGVTDDVVEPPPMVVVAGDPMATFFASGYAYCDAKLLAALWGEDVGQSKATAGQKIINGLASGVTDSLVASRQAGHTCGWEDTGYAYADAEKLAAVWGLPDPYQAKLKAARLATNGQRALMDRLLAS